MEIAERRSEKSVTKRVSPGWLFVRMFVLVPLLGLILIFPIGALFIFLGNVLFRGDSAESTKALAISVGGVTTVGLSAWFSWRILIGSGRPSKSELAEIEAGNQRFRERLLSPDFAALEKHFGHSVPVALRELYANKDELLREDFQVLQNLGSDSEIEWAIGTYNPADEETILSIVDESDKRFPFAVDDCGNHYLVDFALYDPPVIFCDYEVGEYSLVCPSLSKFLKWPRVPAVHQANKYSVFKRS